MHHVAAKYPSEFSEHARQALRSELEMVRKVPLHPNIIRYFGGNISQHHQVLLHGYLRELILTVCLRRTRLQAHKQTSL